MSTPGRVKQRRMRKVWWSLNVGPTMLVQRRRRRHQRPVAWQDDVVLVLTKHGFDTLTLHAADNAWMMAQAASSAAGMHPGRAVHSDRMTAYSMYNSSTFTLNACGSASHRAMQAAPHDPQLE